MSFHFLERHCRLNFNNAQTISTTKATTTTVSSANPADETFAGAYCGIRSEN